MIINICEHNIRGINMKINGIITIIITFLLISTIQVVGSQNNNSTTLEITDIRGVIGGVTADIKNTGSVTAENFVITISVIGGLLNRIDILQECGGCGGCGTTITPGEIKSESTLESGSIMGFGPITVVVTAKADNADLVTKEANGFVLGPFVLII